LISKRDKGILKMKKLKKTEFGMMFALVAVLGPIAWAQVTSTVSPKSQATGEVTLSQDDITGLADFFATQGGNADVDVNPKLRACLYQASGGTSSDCIANTVTNLILFDPSGKPISNLYDAKGVPVTKAADAVFTATPTFKAFCAGSADTCQMANAIQVGYRVAMIRQPYENAPKLSAIGSSYDQNAFKGSNPAIHTIASLTSNSQSNAATQQQICENETADVNRDGGATTACNPNITVIKLYGNSHRANECPSNCMINEVGTEADCRHYSDLTVADNKKYYCRGTTDSNGGYACASGWTMANTWIKNQAVTSILCL